MSDDVTITVTVNNQTTAGFQRINRDVRDVRASLLSLAPAAVPVAAALAPIAVKAGAAGLAVGAFGAALVPQIANLKDAADAQDKYTDAVTKYGANSKQAAQAQAFVANTLKGMPQATQRAAAAYSNLRDQFKAFSDSSAKFTMRPVEHSFAVLGALIPKLTPMARSASGQLDRLVKVAGGAINTRGFDTLAGKVSDFANRSLRDATNGVIHFVRVLSEGNAQGPITQFMAYAKAQGPAVKELLLNLVRAIGNIAQGAAQAGPGLLTIVNAFAKLVAAVPPSLIGALMQVYAAFKLIKLAGVGIGGLAGGFQSLAGRVTALQAASAAAGGGMAGLRAAFLSLGRAAKATVVVAGITALVVVLSKLSSIGKSAPPDVDRMTTSLGNLGRTGKVSGEALRVFGKDLGGLADSLRTLSRPSNLDKTQQFLTSLIGMDSTPVKEAKQNLDAVDKSLANMVKGGKADLAKVAFEDIAKAMQKQGLSSKELKGKLDDYKSAQADLALEQKLTAQSMGLFGDAAQAAQAKLDAQKASADGLRQSIMALNDANRTALGGMIGFEGAIDAAAKAARDNAGALKMHNGELDLNSKKAQDAASALNDLASKTDEAAADARQNGASWEKVNGIYDRGRTAIIKNAQAMGLSKSQAKALADQILKIPDKTARVKMDTEDARRSLEDFNAAVKRSPGSKSVTLKTLSGAAEKVLESFGYKVTHLKDGSVKVTAKTGGALSAIRNVAGAIASLRSKTVTLTANYRITGSGAAQAAYSRAGGHQFAGNASGGLVRGYAAGGDVQSFPTGGYVQGPGSGTSDSILGLMGSGAMARVSNTEYVVRSSAVKKYGLSFLDALNSGRLKVAGFARGGLTSAERDARNSLRGQFGISSFGRAAGYRRTPFEHNLSAPADVNALVSSLNDAAGRIRAAFSGKTESRLLHQLGSVGRSLIRYEKSLTRVTASLDRAKSKLDDLKGAASQLKDSVKSGILSGANITRSATAEDSRVTINTILSQMSGSAANASEFDAALKKLKAKGLSSDLLSQIAQAGIEGGGLETAQALLGGSTDQIRTLNSLQGQITKSAGSAGATTADAVYGAQIRVQERFVKSLERQQAKLEKAMSNLAKTMEKAISKALGRKAAGGIVGAAASGGLRSNLTWVGEQGPELLDLPTGSRVWSHPDSRRMAAAPWASMLTHRGRVSAARQAAGAAASGQPLVIHLNLAGKDIGEVIIDPLRRSIYHRGGNVQAILGRN